jgi:CDP-glycerol glycerophosphotransferase
MTSNVAQRNADRVVFDSRKAVAKIRRGLNLVLYYLSGIFPRSRHRVAFGAWHGYRYSDNPRYLYEHLRKGRSDLDLVWCGREATRPLVPTGTNARFVKRGIRSVWNVLRARTIFVSHGWEDLVPFNLTCRANLVYLGHGLAIKNMGLPETGPTPTNRVFALVRRARRAAVGYSYFIASSPAQKEKLLVEYASQNCREDNTPILGQPRCDIFTSAEGRRIAEWVRGAFSVRYGLDEAKRIVTYMPTFRDGSAVPFSFADLPTEQAERLHATLDRHDAVLVQRSHFVDGVLRLRGSNEAGGTIIDLSSAVDVDSIELLLISDLLITDYSGAYVDYLLLDRPILHFVYDHEEYLSSDRGLYFNLEEVAGGPLVRTVPDLLEELDLHLSDSSLGAKRRARVRNMLLTSEHGGSCVAVEKRLLPAGSSQGRPYDDAASREPGSHSTGFELG